MKTHRWEDYLRIADEYSIASLLLFSRNSYRGAVSQAYVAYLDSVYALLSARNESAKSYTIGRTLFRQYYINTGIFPELAETNFHELYLLRQLADYEAETTISADDALKAVEITARFIKEVNDYLQSTESQPLSE